MRRRQQPLVEVVSTVDCDQMHVFLVKVVDLSLWVVACSSNCSRGLHNRHGWTEPFLFQFHYEKLTPAFLMSKGVMNLHRVESE